MHYDVIELAAGGADNAKPTVVVLLHGAGGSAAVWWQNAGAFSCRVSVVLPFPPRPLPRVLSNRGVHDYVAVAAAMMMRMAW